MNQDGEGAFSLRGLSRDSYIDSDTSGVSITLNAGQGMNQDDPFSMSEFYGYDHDAVVGYYAFLAEDWQDALAINAGNDVNMDTRATFNATLFEDATDRGLYFGNLGETNQTTTTVTDRPLWSTYGTPSINTDSIRFTNTNQTYGMFCKTTDHSTIAINNVPTDQCIAWRWRFFMNSTNNKDHTSVIRMNTTNHTNPAISTNCYTLGIRDNADPATGQLYINKRTSTTSQTTIASSDPAVYTMGTTQDIVLSWHRAGSGRSATYTWKVGMAPTTTLTATIIKNNNKISVDDGTYFIAYGWSLRVPKAMSTPTSTHYHAIDNASIVQMTDPTS
jgi:hypothetical protein